jgi:cyclopropane fatty-acyl-phospholipid synthase-like methyltransferase
MNHKEADLPVGARTDRVDIHSSEVDSGSLLAHLARYMFVARQLCGDEKLIEVGTGTGYGAMTLSKVAGHSIGFDPYVDAASLNEKWGGENLSFVDSIEGLSDFDVVVALEVIEHMPRRDADDFLRSLKSLGHKNSKWFISTPRSLPDEQRSENRKRAHPFEYTFLEFKTVLEDHFQHVHLFSQNDAVISTQNPNMAWNYIAICTN